MSGDSYEHGSSVKVDEERNTVGVDGDRRRIWSDALHFLRIGLTPGGFEDLQLEDTDEILSVRFASVCKGPYNHVVSQSFNLWRFSDALCHEGTTTTYQFSASGDTVRSLDRFFSHDRQDAFSNLDRFAHSLPRERTCLHDDHRSSSTGQSWAR